MTQQADPTQLQQTIIYLRAELNKYRMKEKQTAASLLPELEAEIVQLHEQHQQLQYTKRKLEKRIVLYEKRMRTLETKVRKAEADKNQLYGVQKELRALLAKQPEGTCQDGQRLGIQLDAATNLIVTKLDELKDLTKRRSYDEDNEWNMRLALQQEQQVVKTQQELIAVLETYVEQLTRKLDDGESKVIIDRIISFLHTYQKRQSE